MVLGGGEEQNFLNLTVEFEISREKDCLSNVKETKHTFENSAHYTQPHYTQHAFFAVKIYVANKQLKPFLSRLQILKNVAQTLNFL